MDVLLNWLWQGSVVTLGLLMLLRPLARAHANVRYVVCWAALLIQDKRRPAAPAFFLPLAAYGAMTLVSSLFSSDRTTSLVDSKQLVLLAIVPAVYEIARGKRAAIVIDVIVSVGAASAAFGIIQYGLLHYDNLGQRP